MHPKLPSLHLLGSRKAEEDEPPATAVQVRKGRINTRTTRKQCLVYTAAILLSMTVILLVGALLKQIATEEYVDVSWSMPVQTPREERILTTLPEMPSDDRQMAAQLFQYISMPSTTACLRQLRFGGTPRYSRAGYLYLDGDQPACLERGFSLNVRPCLVYSVRNGGDTSFERAMHWFGCQVHSFDDSSEPEDPTYSEARVGRSGSPIHHSESISDLSTVAHLRYRLGHSNQPIAFLSVTAPGVEDLVLEHPEALEHVEQLALRLHFTDHLPNGRDRTTADTMAVFRRRYRQLVQLQRSGFKPFEFSQLDSHGAINMTIAGLREPLTSVQDVVLINTILL